MPCTSRRPVFAAFLSLSAMLGLAAGLVSPVTAAEQMLRVIPLTKADQARLHDLAPEAHSCGSMWSSGGMEFAAPEGRAAELRAQGFEVEILIEDLEAFYLERMEAERAQRGDAARGGGDFGEYHTYTEAIAAMDALASSYPALMTPKQSIGTTIEGRTIWVYKLSDNPLVDEDEPEVFFNAYIHAREAITFEIVYDLAQYLLGGYGSDARATDILDGREVWILPVVNPDGVEHNRTTNPGGGGMWRKNRRNNGSSFGVDLNRNFGFVWGWDNVGSSPTPSSETYRGTAPFSEPETQAIRQFVNSRDFGLAVNYHSYSNLHLFSFGFEVGHAPDYDEMLALGQLRKVDNGYNTGSAWEVLYRVNGDANDWMYGEDVEKPSFFAFVTEVGLGSDGFWPLESRIPALVAENRESNLRTCEFADNPYRALLPDLVTVTAPATTDGSYTVSFGSSTHNEADNPAVAWNLIEATGHSVGADDVEGTAPSRWTPDVWAVSTARSHSATHSWYSGVGDNRNNTLTSRRAYKVQPGDQLTYWTWYNTETNWDYGYVEISSDGRDFSSLPGNFTTDNDPNAHNLGNGLTGNSNGWKFAIHDLSAHVGQTVWFRFRYSTDGGSTNEGWYVDDIAPAHLFASETTVANGLASAQYTFANHAEGEYWYIAQAVDGEAQTSPWSEPKMVMVEAATSVDNTPAAAWAGLQLSSANPIRAAATLRFAVPADAREGEHVRLSIYDISGREVGVMVDGRVEGSAGLRAGATVESRWDAAGAPAGIYFARLTSGVRVSERRLVLLD